MTRGISEQSTKRWLNQWADHPLIQLVWTRILEFYREPEAIFWVYVFPLVMTVSLGIAFRNQPVIQVAVDIAEGPGARLLHAALVAPQTFSPNKDSTSYQFRVRIAPVAEAYARLRVGRTDIVLQPLSPTVPARLEEMRVRMEYDPTRRDSVLARTLVQEALERAAGQEPAVPTEALPRSEPGGRYIDYLVPGLVGMNLLAGGLWGIGYVTVELRVRNLLKRLLATPMHRTHFLTSLLISRFLFTISEVVLLLLFAWVVFGVRNFGSYTALAILLVLGAWSFSGLGLLVACRAHTLEAISGLINIVTLPMWLLSGVFFSYERFPETSHAFIRLLPLTSFNDALRSVMLEGKSLSHATSEIALLLVWGIVSFGLAMRWFRWK
jgi:ABC-2 type transport system permease protein